MDRAADDVTKLSEERDLMKAELEDFKENKTMDAYFKRLKYIPNAEDRLRLISQIDEFLGAESIFSGALQNDGNDKASGAS